MAPGRRDPAWPQAVDCRFVSKEDQSGSREVILVDPSLFTPAYDAGLNGGLKEAGLVPRWPTRPLRRGEAEKLPSEDCEAFFYRRSENLGASLAGFRGAAKGIGHVAGLLRLIAMVWRRRPLAVHMQWAVLPVFDALAMRIMRQVSPVVMTVHDTVPFNDERISMLQNIGFDLPIKAADRVVVHTHAASRTLIARGIPVERIAVVPHGPLALACAPRPAAGSRDPRWTFVLFGQLKPYKGLDILIEAVGAMTGDARARSRFVVAGAARMDLEPLRARIEELGLSGTVELRIGRLAEQEMADLFAEADAFVFPYRQIDASGVYFMLKPLRKWMVASRVGIFADHLADGRTGALVPPADVPALAVALAETIAARPVPDAAPVGPSWAEIGRQTKDLYEQAAMQPRGLTLGAMQMDKPQP